MNGSQSGMTRLSYFARTSKVALSSGGAVVGSLLPIPGLNILTAGSFAGDWDSALNYELGRCSRTIWVWQNSIFNGFNDTVRGLSESNDAWEYFPI